MAANNRSGMRPAGRSPPFLAIGLTVALVILGFNYWSLSARNGEQADEIAVLESEMRLINAKKLSAEKRSETISDKVKDLENEVNKQKAVVADKMAQMSNLGAEKENLVNEKQKCDADFQSCNNEQLPACRKENENLQSELETVKETLENERNQNRDAACDESKCASFSDQARNKVLEDLYSILGSGPLVALHQKGVSVGKFEPEIAQMAAQVQQQQQQQQPVNQMGGQINPGALPIVKTGQNLPQQQQQQQQPGQEQQGPDAGDLNQKLADLHGNMGAQPADQKPADVGAQTGDQENPLPQVPNPMDGAQPRPDQQEHDRIYPDRPEQKQEGENKEQGNTTMSTAKPGSRENQRATNKLGDKVVGTNLASKQKATIITTTATLSAMANGNRAQSSKVKGNQLTNTSTEGPRIGEEGFKLNSAPHKSLKASLKHNLGDEGEDDQDNGLDDENPDDVYDNEDDDDQDDADGNADDPQDDDVLRVLPHDGQDNDYDDDDEDDDYNYKDDNFKDDLDDQNELDDLQNTEDEVDQMRANLEDPISDH